MSKTLDHIRHTYGHLQTAARGIDSGNGEDHIISSLEQAVTEAQRALVSAKNGELHSGSYVGMPKKGEKVS